jgi:hypothetical protein
MDDMEIKVAYLTEVLGLDEDTAMRNADEVILFQGSLREYAEELVDDIGLDSLVGDYFDYEAFGRDVRLGGDLELFPELEGMSDRDIGYEVIDSLGGTDQVRNPHFYVDYDMLGRDLRIGGDVDDFQYDGVNYVIANPREDFTYHNNPSMRRNGYDSDETAIRDILLTVENTADFYYQVLQPTAKNLANKIYKGQYDPEKAFKAYKNVADLADKFYNWHYVMSPSQHRGGYWTGAKGYILSPNDRRVLAGQLQEANEELVQFYVEQLQSGVGLRSLRNNPTMCTDGKISFADVGRDPDGNYVTRQICTGKGMIGRDVKFEDGKPVKVSPTKTIKAIKDSGVDATVGYVHPDFASGKNITNLKSALKKHGFGLAKLNVTQNDYHSGGWLIKPLPQPKDKKLKKNPEHNDGYYQKIGSKYRIGHDEILGVFGATEPIFKTVKEAKQGINAIEQAYYYGTRGHRYMYRSQGRYGYWGVDYADPDDFAERGAIQGTAITGLTRKGGDEMVKVLTKANQEGLKNQ